MDSAASRLAPRSPQEPLAGGREERPLLRLATAPGRWTVAAAVLSSGAVFLESTVVTVALPALARDLGLGFDGLQWVLNSYLLTLSALMLLGGSLGDIFGHRSVLAVGVIGFTGSSLVAALAPSAGVLIGVRLLQGAAGAILVPNTLALLSALFEEGERDAAIGRWAAWSAISPALGLLAGGWLVDAFSWRWVFAIPAPFGLLALWITLRRVPADPPRTGSGSGSRVDAMGAILATLGLAALTWALIAAGRRGLADPLIVTVSLTAVGVLGAFLAHERRAPSPMLPLGIFRTRQFSGANAVTLLVYAALGGLFFLLMLQLQNVMGYSALRAGAALLPINGLMLVLSPPAGRLSHRIGPRGPIGVGAIVGALGMLLLARVQPGADYVGTVLPGLLVFGSGLALLVAPLTAAVMGAVSDEQGGIASGVNNAVARLAGLLATAALPLAAGLGPSATSEAAFGAGYARAMTLAAGLCAAGAVVALLTIRRGGGRRPTRGPNGLTFESEATANWNGPATRAEGSTMANETSPALTPEQWESRDYRQGAAEVDNWAAARRKRPPQDDATEYVAKLGLREDAAVVAMSRAHDRVVVPPPARPALAAYALADQPFGFSQSDVELLRRAASLDPDEAVAGGLQDLARRIAALLPPAPA
jgi:EmrB/QacA subfamily drug resistance transporter